MEITRERLNKFEKRILEILEEKASGKDSSTMKATEIDIALKFIRLFRARLIQQEFQEPSFNIGELELPF